MFEDYLNEMRIVAWIAAMAASGTFICLMVVWSEVAKIKEMVQKNENNGEKIAETVAQKLAKFTKRNPNQPPPPPAD